MIKEFDKWTRSLEKCIEEGLGPIPYFKYKESGGLYWGYKEYPFMVDYDETPLFLVGRKGMNNWFFNGLRGKKTHTKERRLGHLIFSLVHDIIHIYQLRTGNFSSHYDNWVEGLAQLYAIKVCNKMYGEANPEDFSLLKKGDAKSVQEFITISFKSKKYKKSISRQLLYLFVDDTDALRASKIIKQNEFSFSNYPFKINQEIIRKLEKKFDCINGGEYDEIPKKEVQNDPYLWGSFQLSKIISKGKYTMEDLINTPLSNRELKKLSQTLKNNHSS